MRYLDIDALLECSDLVFTAEGAIDYQTPLGKIPAEVARRAKLRGLPVVALAGTIGKDASVNLQHGIDAYASLLETPCTLAQAIEDTPRLLRQLAERVMRFILIGRHRLPASTSVPARETFFLQRITGVNSAELSRRRT
jgi:glycerate kinase